jgi:leucyl aminopeptidase
MTMALVKVGLAQGAPAKLQTQLVAMAVTEEDAGKGGFTAPALVALDKALGGALSAAAKEAEFEGKASAELSLHTHGRIPASRVVLLGLGRAAKVDRDAARLAGCRAAKAAERAKAAKAALVFPFGGDAVLFGAAAEGVELGAYKFDQYLSDRKPRKLERLDLVTEKAAGKGAKEAVEHGVEVAEAVNLARDLVNEPAAVVTPTALADTAKKVAKAGGLKAEVLERKEIQKLGMNMFLGVAQGSAEAPKLIHVWWEPEGKGKKQKPLAFVGKAITFDSGGLSIKTAQGMETMKTDMAGSAAVIGAMKVVATLKPPFPVHAFIGACENMPSGTAQRPGDIVRSRAGKTVEILNTDAEGRLVLGDVLSWAVDHAPSAIVDLATLTGAVIVALGPATTGLFSNDEGLAGELVEASKAAGEQLWRLPLPEHMKELIKSPIADLKNTGGPKGGSITAALFLREFVGDVPWAHLDIAGPSHLDKELGVDPRGGTGHGVRTLVELVRRRMGAQ